MFASDSVHQFTFRQWLPVCIFCIAIVTTEMLIPSLYAGISIPSDPNMLQHAMQDVIENDQDYSVLFLGDSTALQGAIPELFNNLTGLHSYNFGTGSASAAVEDVLTLTRYLKHHPAPKAVFVMRSVTMWHLPLAIQVLREERNTTGLAFSLWQQSLLPINQFLAIATSNLFPSLKYRYRFSRVISALVDESLMEEYVKSYKDSVTSIEHWKDSLGYAKSTGTLEEITPHTLELLHAISKDGHADLRQENIELLTKLCDLGQAHGFPVFVTISPYAQVVLEDPVTHPALEELETDLTQTIANYPACTFLPSKAYDKQLLNDVTHLNFSGAAVFTTNLATIYRESTK